MKTECLTTVKKLLVHLRDKNKDSVKAFYLKGPWSRMGYNGQAKDDEIYGKGNFVNYDARGLDTRVIRWNTLDARALKSPQITPYNFAANNPIIYIDPDGNTEFWFGNKWVGTDGVDNNLIGVLTDPKLASQMRTTSEAGKLNTELGDLHHGDKMNGAGLVINNDVLGKSYEVLESSLTARGKVGEFSTTMNAKGKHFESSEILYTSGTQIGRWVLVRFMEEHRLLENQVITMEMSLWI